MQEVTEDANRMAQDTIVKDCTEQSPMTYAFSQQRGWRSQLWSAAGGPARQRLPAGGAAAGPACQRLLAGACPLDAALSCLRRSELRRPDLPRSGIGSWGGSAPPRASWAFRAQVKAAPIGRPNAALQRAFGSHKQAKRIRGGNLLRRRLLRC